MKLRNWFSAGDRTKCLPFLRNAMCSLLKCRGDGLRAARSDRRTFQSTKIKKNCRIAESSF